MSSFKSAAKYLFDQAFEDIEREIKGLPKIDRPKFIPRPLFKWICLETHTRTGQDIFGRVEFTKGQIIESSNETPQEFAWIVDVTKFERIYE